MVIKPAKISYDISSGTFSNIRNNYDITIFQKDSSYFKPVRKNPNRESVHVEVAESKRLSENICFYGLQFHVEPIKVHLCWVKWEAAAVELGVVILQA